jgi:hypothetical protein
MTSKKNTKYMALLTAVMLCLSLMNISCGKKDDSGALPGSSEFTP